MPKVKKIESSAALLAETTNFRVIKNDVDIFHFEMSAVILSAAPYKKMKPRRKHSVRATPEKLRNPPDGFVDNSVPLAACCHSFATRMSSVHPPLKLLFFFLLLNNSQRRRYISGY